MKALQRVCTLNLQHRNETMIQKIKLLNEHLPSTFCKDHLIQKCPNNSIVTRSFLGARSFLGNRFTCSEKLLVAKGTRNKKLLGARASLVVKKGIATNVVAFLLLVTRMLLGAPGLTTRSKELLVGL